MRRGVLALLGLLVVAGVQADAEVTVCHGYGCLMQEPVRLAENRLVPLVRQLQSAVDPADERKMLAEAIGQLYAWAGEQTDIRNDRGGNYADAGVSGRMDCIDHSTTTTRFLELLARRGALRFHRVEAPDSRAWLGLITNHWSAVIAEKTPAAAAGEGARFVVDSWFVDNGQPAVILPLEEWKKGAGPDV